MVDNNIILNQIKLNLDRLVDKEWPKVEKIIEGHEERLRSLETFQIRLDDLLPRIDNIASEIKRTGDSYARIEDMRRLEMRVSDITKEIDLLKGYVWKSTGAITILAFMIPLLMKYL